MKTTRRTTQLEQGQAIVLIALAMIGLLSFAVLAIDGSRFFDQRRVTQNAADSAALAGLQIQFAPPTGVTPNYCTIIKEINRVAELNAIPDSDGTAGNAVNTYVGAYWINDTGYYVNSDGTTLAGNTEPPPTLAQITESAGCTTSASTRPTGATGIKVRAMLPYRTFLGGLIGRPSMMAQADSTTLRINEVFHDPTTNPIDMTHTSIVNGGNGNCANSLVIASSGNNNNIDLGSAAYITGNGAEGDGNNNSGLFKNDSTGGPAYFSGSTTSIQTSPPTSQIQGGWSNPYTVYPNMYGYPLTFSFLNGTYTDNANYLLLTPWDFYVGTDRSTSDPWTYNYVYRAYLAGGSSPANYFHNVTSAGSGQTYADANGDAVKAAMDSGEDGTYFIDGDVNIRNPWTDHQALIATGRVNFIAGGTSSNALGRADTAGWGYGLSVFSGYKQPTASPVVMDSTALCATGTSAVATNAAIRITDNSANWTGFLFAPWGFVSMESNGNNGHTFAPIVSNSIVFAPDMTNGNDPGNNVNFAPYQCTPTPCVVPHPPTYNIGLQQ